MACQSMTERTHSSVERPLSGGAKTVLVLSALGAIALFYLFSIVSILFLLVLLAVELGLVLVGARFGFAHIMVDVMKRHAPLMGIFVRPFWLGKGTEYRIVIQPDEAPRLFALLERLTTRLQIAPPNEVWIEMSSGAWVRLLGVRKGSGRTILGIGYDLLAGLTVSEVEAVMAHEMAHAKLVRRGVMHWLNAGLHRAGRTAGGLQGVVSAYRNAGQTFELAERLLRVSDAIVAMAARFVTKYSRQDEFEADRGAAELCGAAPMRSALLRLDPIAEKLARLPWSERTAQLQLGGSFSQWLVNELSAANASAGVNNPEGTGSVAAEAHDPYSTHPSLSDRIAALSDVNTPMATRDDSPGIGLLAAPDRVADTLMTEIQRVNAEQEQKDTKSLAKWARKSQRAKRVRWPQYPGLFIVLAGVIWGLVALFTGFYWTALLVGVGLTGLGFWLMRLGRYRDRKKLSLPVPAFRDLKQAWQADRPENIKELETRIENDLNQRITVARGKRRELAWLLDEGYAALGRCEYLRAHVALRFALDRDEKSPEAALGLAIAAAAVNPGRQAGDLLTFVQERVGIGTPNTTWGTAWALVLMGDWSRAEALLWSRHAAQPDNTTFLLLLALAQGARGKQQSAIVNAERAVALASAEIEHSKLLGRLLLDAGRLRDAETRLQRWEESARSDAELAMLMVRLRLLKREFTAARDWAAALRVANPRMPWVIRLGEAFENARADAHAAQFFEEALAAGFFPEAHLGLARLAMSRRDKAECRRHLLAALNLERQLGEHATGPLPLFQAIVGQLLMMEEPRERCVAWVATFPNNPPPLTPEALKNCSLLIYAPDRRGAEGYLDTVLDAMQPATPPARAATLFWREAPKEQQPVRPVRPGVQYAL